MLAILRISRVFRMMTIYDDSNTDFLLYKSEIFKILFSRTFANIRTCFILAIKSETHTHTQ